MPQKILVVDEKLFMLRLIQHHLEKAGYQLIQARNGIEALQAMSEENPHLVLMDDGAQSQVQPALQALKKKKSSQPIPVIRMTETPETKLAPNCESDLVLTKPFSPTQLVNAVKRLVAGKSPVEPATGIPFTPQTLAQEKQ